MTRSAAPEHAVQPEDLSRFFLERANAGDVEGLVALYQPDAVLAIAEHPRIAESRSGRSKHRRADYYRPDGVAWHADVVLESLRKQPLDRRLPRRGHARDHEAGLAMMGPTWRNLSSTRSASAAQHYPFYLTRHGPGDGRRE